MRQIFFLMAALCVLAAVGRAHAAEASPAGNGLFVTVLQEPWVLGDRAAMDRLVADAKAMKVNTIFLQVYRGNRSWFPSRVSDSSPYEQCSKMIDGDPIDVFIKKAHLENIQVHAWMNLLSLGKNTEAPVLKRFGPEILTRNTKEKSSLDDYRIDDQFFLEPGDADVRDILTTAVEELVTAYPALDGIQFDYIRYPDKDPAYGYTLSNMERFKKATGKKKIGELDPLWQDWKRTQVTELVKHLTEKIHALHPGMKVSTTGCAPYSRAHDEAFQDWASWVNSGLIDFVTVMTYAREPAEFDKLVGDAKVHVQTFSKMNIAIGVYQLARDPDLIATQLKICKGAAAGACTIFHYGNLADNPGVMKIFSETKQ